jgi:hypothetical protein
MHAEVRRIFRIIHDAIAFYPKAMATSRSADPRAGRIAAHELLRTDASELAAFLTRQG